MVEVLRLPIGQGLMSKYMKTSPNSKSKHFFCTKYRLGMYVMYIGISGFTRQHNTAVQMQ